MLLVFAWEAYEHGNDIHPLADPTKLEVMHREFRVNKGDFQADQKHSILERYGGEQHLEAPPRELLLAQTEEYLEYSRSGNVLRGQERAVTKSRYEEDVWANNHTVSASYTHMPSLIQVPTVLQHCCGGSVLCCVTVLQHCCIDSVLSCVVTVLQH